MGTTQTGSNATTGETDLVISESFLTGVNVEIDYATLYENAIPKTFTPTAPTQCLNAKEPMNPIGHLDFHEFQEELRLKVNELIELQTLMKKLDKIAYKTRVKFTSLDSSGNEFKLPGD